MYPLRCRLLRNFDVYEGVLWHVPCTHRGNGRAKAMRNIIYLVVLALIVVTILRVMGVF
ncbi:hypothetical protein Z948_1990 [Sulfitobacter donghicola DSW-25 = KCTC 12864 = JCM 14565]|nr:hypothetical protein Z948_1990 [Sulfitobacter donghicola DSW-25 = KCTC 12864 = JCM 14565]